MKQDYFVHKGKKILSGTVIVFKNKEVIFLAYSSDTDRYFLGSTERHYVESWPKDIFERYITCVTDKIDNKYQYWCEQKFVSTPATKESKFTNEINNDNLFLAWIWYIFIMAISIIFNGFWLIWIVASCIFFDYRKEKLRKAGYKQ